MIACGWNWLIFHSQRLWKNRLLFNEKKLNADLPSCVVDSYRKVFVIDGQVLVFLQNARIKNIKLEVGKQISSTIDC